MYRQFITRFEGRLAFLSNFYPSPIYSYPTVEHAYQACKTLERIDRERIRRANTPAEAKKIGQSVVLRPDWDQMKENVMETLVTEKFTVHTDLAKKLLATGDMPIVEGNSWHDNYWGNCTCNKCTGIPGQNKLGKILMSIRTKLQENTDNGTQEKE